MIEYDALGSGKLVVVGHRGALAAVAENTLPSFLAAKRAGVHAFEVDLRLSKDGHVVIMHDATVDRTTTGTGAVADMTLTELRRLQVRNPKGGVDPEGSVPTLEQALEFAVDQDIDVLLELKGEPAPGGELVRRTVAIVMESGWYDRVMAISFHHPSLALVGQLSSAIPTGILYGRPFEDPIGAARAVGATSVRPHSSSITPELVAACREARMALHAWVAYNMDDVWRLANLGVDSLAVDDPADLIPKMQAADLLYQG